MSHSRPQRIPEALARLLDLTDVAGVQILLAWPELKSDRRVTAESASKLNQALRAADHYRQQSSAFIASNGSRCTERSMMQHRSVAPPWTQRAVPRSRLITPPRSSALATVTAISALCSCLYFHFGTTPRFELQRRSAIDEMSPALAVRGPMMLLDPLALPVAPCQAYDQTHCSTT